MIQVDVSHVLREDLEEISETVGSIQPTIAFTFNLFTSPGVPWYKMYVGPGNILFVYCLHRAKSGWVKRVLDRLVAHVSKFAGRTMTLQELVNAVEASEGMPWVVSEIEYDNSKGTTTTVRPDVYAGPFLSPRPKKKRRVVVYVN